MQPRWMQRMLSLVSIGLLAVMVAACGQSANNGSAGTQGGPSSSSAADGSNAGTPSTGDGKAQSLSSASGEGGITVQDAQGNVTLPKKPERIVAMEFSFTDMLVSLGVRPVGVADDGSSALLMDAVKSALGAYTSVGSRYEPNIELISSLKPDLIIVDLNKHKNAIEQLKKIAPVLVLDDYQADYDQMLKNVEIVAKAVGREEEGRKRLAEHQAKMDAAIAKIKNANMTVLPAVVNPNGFFAHSDHSYSGSLIAKMGFTDPVKNENAYPQLTLEQLVETNPQAMFLMPTEKETIVNQWEKNPLWSKIEAVANKRVFTVERRDWSLSRGPIGSEKMAEDIIKFMGE